MANSNKTLFETIAHSTKEKKSRKRTSGLLEQRSQELSELSSGAIEDKVHRWVDPTICKIRENHNRRYDLLSPMRCQDLIDGFKSQGKQEFPAIVRTLKNDPQYEYEVICGARRHWTVSWLRSNNYPEFKYLIEVRDLTDEQAFRLSDIENRDKEDLSDYERAVDYKMALGSYYKNQKNMAERMEVSEAWLSRYLDLANLPTEVVESFVDIMEIRVKHGRDLKPFLKDRKVKHLIIKRAGQIKKEQEKRISKGEELLSGASVVKLLVESNKGKPKKNTFEEYTSSKGKPMLSFNLQDNGKLILQVIPKSGATKEELLKACENIISNHFK